VGGSKLIHVNFEILNPPVWGGGGKFNHIKGESDLQDYFVPSYYSIMSNDSGQLVSFITFIGQ